MLRNYFKIAVRNLKSRKGYSAINIAGLSIGLAVCLLIGMYVQDELSYDEFHENADRTYRVLREFDIPDLQTTIPSTPSALAPAVKENLPAIEKAVRVNQASPVVEYGVNKFVETSFIAAESGFFEIFSFPLLRGEAVLNRPSTIVISEAMATKYFASENPVGKIMQVGSDEFEVTGVMANVPPNSHLQFNFVASLEAPNLDWGRNNFITYLLLREGQSKKVAAQQITDLIQSHTNTDNERSGSNFIPHLQPVTGIHLGQGISVNIDSQGNIFYVCLFIALAIFILLLACINFMNLATARSTERAREVGMRKTLGAGRLQIAFQFLSESVMMTALAFVLALAIAQVALPLLNNLAGKSLELSALYNAPTLFGILVLILFIGVFSGFYPALVLSSFKPSKVIEGMAGTNDQFRKGLIVFQFAITISLLVATGVVYQQLQFMKSSGLGFNEENVVLIERANFIGNQIETFRQEVTGVPGIEHAASGFSMPGTFFINSMWQPDEPGSEAQNMDYSFVGFEYTETLDIEIVAGRSFSQAFATDSTAALLNETAVRDFGWSPEEAIGKQLIQGSRKFTVIGVAENFHYESLHSEIYPMVLFGPQRTQRYIAVRLSPENISGSLEVLQEKWGEFSDLPFEYSFLADNLAAQYRSEERLSKVFGAFAGLAILIACLGLFGLAAFMVSKRTKEIGVRKVLGASIHSIIGLLNKDFLKLVAMGFVIAVPIAWYSMNEWLANFSYRIEIGTGIFLLAGSVAILIALATVSWQSISAATMNPTESLKSE